MTNKDYSQFYLPNEQQRKQLFYFLKKCSSVTGWRRILSYYQQWADLAESSLKIASSHGWEMRSAISADRYVSILHGLAHMEEGVKRLQKGNKLVFKYDANGEFAMAVRPLSFFNQLINRIDEGENYINEDKTPLWSEFRKTTLDFGSIWGECGPYILEKQYVGALANVEFNDLWVNRFQQWTFPDPLQDVPNPLKNTIITTGKHIPCSGIWEPVDLPPENQTFRLFSKPPVPEGMLPVAGTMNYLHQGSDAPPITLGTRDERSVKVDKVCWRLLWKDDRYLDGSIPDEESSYIFLEPIPEEAPTTIKQHGTEGDLVWAESGAPAPVSGRWLVESDTTASVEIASGDLLPLHHGREVRWVLAN